MKLTEGQIVYYENLETAALTIAAYDDGTADLQLSGDGPSVDLTAVPFSEEPKPGHWSFLPDDYAD